jgi:hypothetical protein
VSLDKRSGRWRAYTDLGHGRRYIGRFDTAKEAALAYDKSAKLLIGERAVLNFMSIV